MYRILNPMNHNVSLVRNDKGEEVIVIGKGIAFGKKKGDLIAENHVEKIFRMKTEESRENFIPNHSYLSQLDVTYKTPDLMSHFLPPHEVSFTFCCSSIVFPR